MALEVYKDPQQLGGFVLCIVSLPICILATVLRVVSTKRAGRKIGMEDWFALAALAFYLIYVVMFLYILVNLNGKSLVEYYIASPEKATSLLRVSWAMAAQFVPNQTLTKFCLLALYYRLFSLDRIFVACVWFLALVQLGWGIGCYLVHYFGCTPVSKAWEIFSEGTCIDTNLFLLVKEPINSIIDFAMAGLAVWMLRFLHLQTWTKIKISILFAIGSLSGVIGFVKMAEAQHSAASNLLDIIWDIVQMVTSIICCCAPIYKTVLPELGFMKSIRSWASRSFSTSKGSGPVSPATSQKVSRVSDKDMTLREQPWLHLDGWDLNGLVTRNSENAQEEQGPIQPIREKAHMNHSDNIV